MIEMEADRRIMALLDCGWTLAGLLFGAFVGLIITTMAMMAMFRGLWILVLLALPLLLIQLLFALTLDGPIGWWKRRRTIYWKSGSVPTLCHWILS